MQYRLPFQRVGSHTEEHKWYHYCIVMPKPFVPDYQRKTIPLVPMVAISFVSFLDNFCYSLTNPIIPYMTQEYMPDVSISSSVLTFRFLLPKSVSTAGGLQQPIRLAVFRETFSGVGLQTDMGGDCPFP